MSNSTLQAVTQPDTGATDPLHELLRKGARDLIAKAVEAELSTFLEQYADKTLEDGRRVASQEAVGGRAYRLAEARPGRPALRLLVG